MANCVHATSIPVRVGGIFVDAPAFHSDIAPPANPNASMKQCRQSCGMVGSCEPVGFRRVRRESIQNPTGGVEIPSSLSNPVDLSEDDCLNNCRKNKDCKGVLHDSDDTTDKCFHLSDISSHRTLKEGSAQLFLRT